MAENKAILKDTCVSQSDFQTTEVMNTEEMGIFQESHAGRRNRSKSKGELVSWKRFHTVLSTTCWSILRGKSESQTRMDQLWAVPHLVWNCLAGQILGLLF